MCHRDLPKSQDCVECRALSGDNVSWCTCRRMGPCSQCVVTCYCFGSVLGVRSPTPVSSIPSFFLFSIGREALSGGSSFCRRFRSPVSYLSVETEEEGDLCRGSSRDSGRSGVPPMCSFCASVRASLTSVLPVPESLLIDQGTRLYDVWTGVFLSTGPFGQSSLSASTL